MTLREEIEAAFRTPKGFWMRAKIEDAKNVDLLRKIRSFFPAVSRDEAIWLCWSETKPPLCLHCNGPIIFKCLKDGYNSVHCSMTCASKATYGKGQATKLIRGTNCDFGSENYKQAMIEKYGAENPRQVPEIQAKTTATLLKRYGVTSALHLVQDRVTSQHGEVANEKRTKTNMERYGSVSPFGSKDIQEKSKSTLFQNYGVHHPMHSSELLTKCRDKKLERWKPLRVEALKSTVTLISSFEELISKNSLLTWECVTCKKIFKSNLDDGKTPRCTACTPGKKIGRKMAERFSLLIGGALGPEKQNDRTIIYPKELDFYFSEKNLAVEFSGLYWHGELVRGKKKAEAEKLKRMEGTGIRLLTFFEDELLDKPDVVRSIVLAAGGVFERRLQARKLQVVELTSFKARAFIEKNHLQGYAGGFLRLGLMTTTGELVAAMIIGKSRFAKSAGYELIRYCQLLNTQIVGAFGKLLSAAKKSLIMGILVSYADIRIFTGASYLHHGFRLKRVNPPGFYWTDYASRLNRQTFQKYKLIKKYGDVVANSTALEIMAALKYDRVWDCGQAVYELDLGDMK